MTQNAELTSAAKEQEVTALAAQSEELTPEQKKQLAKDKAPDTGLSDAINSKKQAKGALATDLDTNDTNEVLAAVANASAKPVAEKQQQQQPPGSFNAEPKKSPSQAGWTSFSKLPNPGDESALETLKQSFSTDALVDMFKGSRTSDKSALHNDLLAQYLKDSHFGEWYHNAGCIMFTVFSTWLLTKLGGGLMACLVIGAFSATYYQTSIRRLRRNVRDDIERELSLNRLETDTETADWINHFVSRFWLIYEPVLSAQIIGIADAILIENTPSFLDSIRLSTFTLGTKPFRINSIKTYPRTEPNVVCMDWTVSFTPHDVLDMTQRDLQSKVNPKIVLTIRVGKGMIGAGMPVLLEDLAFSGKLRLKFKFFNEFPHVKTVEASFLEKPQFDYSLKPVGGETFGFDINNIPGLQTFVQEQVHATLGPMMYAPNVYTVDVAGMMAGTTDLTSANGVLAITIYSASNLKSADLFGSLDPYITFHVGNVHNAELARTTALEDTSNPRWDETHFVLLNSLNESLYLQVMDRNSGRKDAAVGVATFDLKQVDESDNVVEGLNLVVLRSGKPVGEIKCDMRYFPVSKPDKKEDGTIIPAAESNTGVLRFNVHECKQLGGDNRGSGFGIPIIGGKDSINAYAIVKVNGKERLRTKVFKRSINPRWDKFVEIFVADKTKLDLSVTIMDSKEFADDEVIGCWSSSLTEMEEENIKNGKDWWHLKDGAGQIHLSSMWKPIVMTGFAEGLGHGSYRPPIGVIRVHFVGARDLKNVEGMGGKSDPYARVLSGMQVRAQTDYILDNLDPEWDTALYVPVHSMREDLVFEVMDYNDISKDKSIGLCDFLLKDVIKETKTENDQVVYDALEPVDRWVELTNRERKKGKGQLHYIASFIPIMEFEKQKKKEEETAAEAGKDAPQQEAPATPPQEPADASTAAVLPTIPEKEIHGEVVKVTEDRSKVNLLAYESGVLTVAIHEVKLPEKYRVNAEILLDSVDPQYRTAELKGNDLPFNETGDAFVKEMDFSKLMVRVRPVRDNDKEDEDVGQWSSSVRDIVRRLMERDPSKEEEEDEGQVYKLANSNGGTIRLSFKFTPVVKFKLDPRESLENQGNLTVTAIKASNLAAADRGGTSDPYVVFSIDEVKLHKTEVYKKQLSPVFKNETFTVPVPNRVGIKLKASVYDWDAVGKDELIGEGETTFDGQVLESFAAKDVEVSLGGGATLRLRLLWQPQLLARKRQGTSLLGSTTRIFTAVPGAAFGVGKDALDLGVGAGTKVLGTGGKVIGGGVSAIGGGVSAIGNGIRGIGRLGKKSSDASSDSSSVVVPPAPQPAPTQSTQSVEGVRSSLESSTARISVADSGNGGTFNVSLLGARNLTAMDKGGTSDPYARVRYGSKVVYKTKTVKKTLQPEWNESFSLKVSEGRSQLDIKVKDKNTLNDVDIGDCTLDVYSVVQNGQPFDGWVPLEPKGSGEVHIRVEAVAASENGNGTRQGLFGKMMS